MYGKAILNSLRSFRRWSAQQGLKWGGYNLKKIALKRKGIYIVPSLLTSANIFCGFYALISIYYERIYPAALAILIAIVLDGLDGRVARITNACTDFGVEYDSLADFVTFGVAPGLLVYSWSLEPLGRIGILAAFLYVICGALRLARFNVHFSGIKSNDFVGLPIPAAAGFLAALMILSKDLSLSEERIKGLIFLIPAYLLAFLMVSNIRYPSFKHLNLRKRKPFGLLVVMVLAILVVGSLPQILTYYQGQ
jgi:CDP-diacylglycerol---serine O-phosphatidyltransferase